MITSDYAKKINMVGDSIVKLLATLNTFYPKNVEIKAYKKRLTVVNMNSAELIHQKYESTVYRHYRNAINNRDEDFILSRTSMSFIEDESGEDSLIKIFVTIWNKAPASLKKYVFDVLININNIIDSM